MRKIHLNHFFSLTLLFIMMFSMLSIAQQQHSIGPSPYLNHSHKQDFSNTPVEGTTTGYGALFDIGANNNRFFSVPMPAGTPINLIGSALAGLIQGGDFGDGGVFFGTANNNQLLSFNLTTGASTLVASITGVTAGQTITALGYHPGSNTMYMGTTNITTSQLYTLNTTTGAATLIGNVTNCAGLIAIGVNCDGNIYAIDIISDNLVSVNPTTGAGTVVGALGFDANFAQDADFDFATNTLYLAAYNNGTSAGELRSANLTTGATTLVVSWGQSEVTGFGIQGSCAPPTGPGQATNPNPVDGANNVNTMNLQLSWTNPAGATSNEVLFGTSPGSLSSIHSGSLVSSVNAPSPLTYNTTYYWRVNEIDGSGTTQGQLWSFTTMEDPAIVTAYFNDFEGGIAGWTVTNDGTPTPGCEWKVTARRTGYTLPGTGQVLRADVDDCGSGSNLNSTATLDQSIDATNYLAVELQFANDWRTLQATDEAHVEVSTDGGTTWTSVWSQVGTSVRNTTETVMISSAVAQTNFKIRLRSVQPGWDWWWVVDNFRIRLWNFIPVELASFSATSINKDVVLNWTTATETNNQGFEVERGVNGQFSKIGYVAGYGTTTEIKSYSFTDHNVTNGNYVYRLKQIDFDGTFSYSSEVEVEVNNPVSYTLDQNFPNPFNPSTKIGFTLAVDSKVSLKVFDVLGQEVSVIVSTDLSAGRHEISFDASNLNSGVYFYTIEAKGSDGKSFTNTKKMILTK